MIHSQAVELLSRPYFLDLAFLLMRATGGVLALSFEEPIFELNSHDPQSVQQLVDYLASLTKQEEAGEKTHHSE